MPRLLILCPLKKELTYLREGLVKCGWEFESQSTPRLSLHHCASRSVTLAVGGHGKVQFGIQTQYLLHHFNDVKSVICVGAGGGLAEHVKVGDVVVAEKTVEHDYTEAFAANAVIPEFFAHPQLLQKTNRAPNRIQGDFKYTVHFGSIASGDEDIVDAKRAQELYEKTGALAVAWEGVGGARACRFNEIPYIELRVITDNARDSVAESFAKNLQPCMHNAADFIHRLLDESPVQP